MKSHENKEDQNMIYRNTNNGSNSYKQAKTQ